jgi:hypothetical protein
MTAVQINPLERTPNVHWAEGLAVIFAPQDADSPPFVEPTTANQQAAMRRLKSQVQVASP